MRRSRTTYPSNSQSLSVADAITIIWRNETDWRSVKFGNRSLTGSSAGGRQYYPRSRLPSGFGKHQRRPKFLMMTVDGKGPPKLPAFSSAFTSAVGSFRHAFVISDPALPDCPIIFASDGFYEMTGYEAEEVIGRNCRFLQGAETNRFKLAKVRQAVNDRVPCTVRLLNYKKNGTPFWNLLTISPIHLDGSVKFLGVQVDVSQETEGSFKEVEAQQGADVPLMIRYEGRLQDRAMQVEEEVEVAVTSVDVKMKDSSEEAQKHPRPVRRAAFDMATTLERLQKCFVISDPSLPDCPIVFVSEPFLLMTGYSREEILGRNCRFLQGEGTDRAQVKRIRQAVDAGEECTVQLLNYTKQGKPFWNMLHIAPVRSTEGDYQFCVGIQLDVTTQEDRKNLEQGKLTRDANQQDAISQKQNGAFAVDAVHKLWNNRPTATGGGYTAASEKLWLPHVRDSKGPHAHNRMSWHVQEIRKYVGPENRLSMMNFRPVKHLGRGDVGCVELVRLANSEALFAMKFLQKKSILERNKVHRALTERDVLSVLDHPFLPVLYGVFQTDGYICFVTEYCPGGEMYQMLSSVPENRVSEPMARFYCAEVLLALEYLHLHGIIYRDLKPENILLRADGHILLTDFDLSYSAPVRPRVELMPAPVPPPRPGETTPGGRSACASPNREARPVPMQPVIVAEPEAAANSFVGTAEYLAPEVIENKGHSAQVDWWALGIFLYELLYGQTPFVANSRTETFRHILHSPVRFPPRPLVRADAHACSCALTCSCTASTHLCL
eukprot:jgi/Mesvir1/17735/Mv05592-RA.1